MRSKPTSVKRRRMYAALACTLLPIAVLAVADSPSWRSQALSKTSPKAAELSTAALAVQTQNRLEAEHITLRPTGFEPAEITRPAGRFLLAVNDRSGEESVTLLLVRGTGDVLTPVRMRERPRKFEWRQVVNLPAGRYELREAAHPEWRCQITVTGN